MKVVVVLPVALPQLKDDEIELLFGEVIGLKSVGADVGGVAQDQVKWVETGNRFSRRNDSDDVSAYYQTLSGGIDLFLIFCLRMMTLRMIDSPINSDSGGRIEDRRLRSLSDSSCDRYRQVSSDREENEGSYVVSGSLRRVRGNWLKG
ncbi:hypothetical protein BY996DRAFT_6583208 [Phakopsora pachyrhizi]|nr:hypothetical protein BY996DRAFT_6583208 [Phakopsora pachyrhizi]